MPEGVGVSGGMAADDLEYARTWVIDHGVAREGVLAAVGFYGEGCRIGHGWRCGWDVFGPERVVTRASGNVVYELDGKPALELYKMYLGERAYGLPATSLLFPLAIRTELPGTHRIVRAALGSDETTASMRFGGEVPEGALVQLMHANADRLVQGASQAAHRSAGPHADAEPVLAIAISCAGRRFVLGERTEDETEAVLESLPEATRQVGFYGYGELCPPSGGGCDLHNQAMTLTTVSEAP